jgi:replicative DNA helicase
LLAVAQVNGNLTTRNNKHPQLEDLRESGVIEQDADVVIFTYRLLECMGAAEKQRELKKWNGWETWDLIVARQRDGETAVAHCIIKKDCGQIRSLQVEELDLNE